MKDGNLAIALRAGATSEEEEPKGEEDAPEAEAAANDERAFPRAETVSDRRAVIEELMSAHGEAVLGFCVRMVGDHSLAHDTRQQVFLQAQRDLDGVREPSTLRNWLFAITYHRCLDAIKAERRRLALIENNESAVLDCENPGMGPFEHVDRAQSYAALEACLRLLSPVSRAAVIMHYQMGCTYEEMAVVFGATADALQKCVARALPVLRQCLEKKGWSGE